MTIVIIIVAALGLLLFLWIALRQVRGLYLALFATSVLITPNLPVVRDKFAATEVLMLLTWLGLLFGSGRWQRTAAPLVQSQRVSLLIGGTFVSWIFLSFAVNNVGFPEAFLPSLVETLNFLYGFLIFCTVLVLVDDREKWYGCLYAWLAGAALVSIVGVWALTGSAPDWAYEEFSRRIASTQKNENQVPSFLLPVLAAAIFLAVRRRQSLWRGILAALLTVAMLATAVGSGSRTALLMIALILLSVYFLGLKEAPYRAFNRPLLGVMGVLLAGAALLYVALALTLYQGHYGLGSTPPWQRPVVTLYDWAQGHRAFDETRERQMKLVSETYGKYLWLGAGPKLYGEIESTEEIHNTYASVLVETGLPGLLLFVSWLGHVLWASGRTARRCADPFWRLMVLSLLVGMGALLIYNATMFGLRQRNLWIIAGMLMAVPRLQRAEARVPAPRRATRLPRAPMPMRGEP